jgi:phage shock protein PspC (stress-responsive transcriptional regulator)
MFCTKCGHQLVEGSGFCPGCGVPLGGESAEPVREPFSKKRLARDMTQKSVAGVCSGVAKYLEVDVTIIRILWLCTIFFGGAGVIVYLICWIVMPQDWGEQPAQAAPEPTPAPAPAAEATVVSEPKPNTAE